MNSGKLFLGVLAGLATGAILGILFAPEKGSVTRQNITNKGQDYIDSLKEKFDEFLGSLSDKFEKVKKEATNTTERMNEKTRAHAEKV